MSVTYMQNLNFYTTLLQHTQQRDTNAAEYLEEEINILIHKLKFIPEQQRPAVLILAQDTDFQPLFNEQLDDSVSIAGGKLLSEKYDNPSILVIIQEDEKLYADLPIILQDDVLSRTDAIGNNQVYIIQKVNLGTDPSSFLREIGILAEIIQPKYFIYGHKGTDWVQFDMA